LRGGLAAIAFMAEIAHQTNQSRLPWRQTEINTLMSAIHSQSLRKRLNPLLIATVIVPSALAGVYYGLLASDVYISESRFVVRSPEKPATSGLGLLLKSTGFSNANDEISAAQSAVISRDALAKLNQNKDFVRAMSGKNVSIFDRFDPVGVDGSFEELYKYFKRHVGLENNTSTAISTLSVRAYTPEDARRFNDELLKIAEETVNQLNQRGRQDLIHFATREVDDAKAKSVAAARKLAVFRNHSGVVDPERQATIQLQLISKLQDELIATRTQIVALKAVAKDNAQIGVLNSKAEELTREIAQAGQGVAGGDRSLAATQADYQQLLLESQIADKQLAGALTSLEEARNEARRKQAYVERIVQPNLPDAPLAPRRFMSFLAVLVTGLIAYGVLSMVLAGVREHQD